jgi:hypothetical protein
VVLDFALPTVHAGEQHIREFAAAGMLVSPLTSWCLALSCLFPARVPFGECAGFPRELCVRLCVGVALSVVQTCLDALHVEAPAVPRSLPPSGARSRSGNGRR